MTGARPRRNPSIPAYALTSTFATTEEFHDVAEQCLAAGYRGIKLHAWGDARREHMNLADVIRAGAATFGVRVGTILRGGVTGGRAHRPLADAFRIRAEVHGSDIPHHHLCMRRPGLGARPHRPRDRTSPRLRVPRGTRPLRRGTHRLSRLTRT
ncbi:hypothetical protein ACFWVC_13840 [Streptomyces sp. NPDC058691]|uniref:hypothetical protein n=1 Tax=Streptomyces sp. NPDC058691 TaxID=3346601 RepID=UPI003646D7A4